MTTTANRLVRSREYLGLTVQEVSMLSKLTEERIQALEGGKAPTETELTELSRLYRYPVEYLAGRADLPNPAVVALPRAKSQLTERDEKEIALFAQFLTVAGKAK